MEPLQPFALMNLARRVAVLNPNPEGYSSTTMQSLIDQAVDAINAPEACNYIITPPPAPGYRFAAGFTLPLEMGMTADVLKILSRAYPDSVLGASTGYAWAFIQVPNVLPGKGGAAQLGGMGEMGEAPDFFSGPSGPAPTGAKKPFPTGKPALLTAAHTVVHARLYKGDVTTRRLTFEFDQLPHPCELGSTWGIVLPPTVAGHAVPCQEAPFLGWSRHTDDDWPVEIRGGRVDALAWRHESTGQVRWTIDPAATNPSKDGESTTGGKAIPTLALAQDWAEDADRRFDVWYSECAGIFNNKTQARHFFDAAQPDRIPEGFDMPRALKEAEEDRDRYKGDLDDIGRRIGCDHTEDGLARCVGETFDGLTDDRRILRRLVAARREKDRNGETDLYRALKTDAWPEAFTRFTCEELDAVKPTNREG